jgi:hypothetical protein
MEASVMGSYLFDLHATRKVTPAPASIANLPCLRAFGTLSRFPHFALDWPVGPPGAALSGKMTLSDSGVDVRNLEKEVKEGLEIVLAEDVKNLINLVLN